MTFKKLLAVCFALSMSSTVVQADTLRIGVEGAYPPFSKKETDGSLSGFDIDMALEMCKRLKRECKLVEQEWDGMIPALLVKKYDAIVASLSITEERKKQIDFTEHYYNITPALVAKEGVGFDASNEGLKGKRLGVLRGTIHQCTAEKLFPDAELVLYNTQDEVFQDLASGRLDVELSDSLQIMEGFLNQDMGKGFAFLGDRVIDRDCQGEGIGIAVRKGDTELRDAMNQAIKDMRADGGYAAINDKYFEIDIYGQ